MIRSVFLPNKVISRTLKSASSPAVANKPKRTKWANDYINYPYFFSFDRPHQYFDLNSRLLTVEGNIGVGKDKIARKIADYFSLQYIDDVSEHDLHVVPMTKRVHLDMRQYNAFLPRTARIYTREMFWNDDNPIKYGKPMLLQLHHYYWRFFYCCRGMAHLFNTGQGMVTNRSPFSDNVMALTLKECGLMSDPAYKYYNLMRCESIPNLWKPNIIIYVKASPEMIRQKLKEKNGWEKNAVNISDKFIETYTDILENQYLKKAESESRIFTIDLSEVNVDDDDDFFSLMESMAQLNVDFKEVYEFDTLFIDWRNGTHCRDLLDTSRSYFSSARKCFYKAFVTGRVPYSLHEGAYSEDDLGKIHLVLDNDERTARDSKFNTKYETMKNILFSKASYNYANPDLSPTYMIMQSFD